VGKISLTGGETKGLIICEGELAGGRERGDWCLVGKVSSERQVNKEAFRNVLSQLWRTVGSILFKEVQDNIWLFEFTDKDDKDRVLEGRPWSFDRQIIVLNDFVGSIPPSQMEFTHSPFWIQVHDMPLLCMNKIVGQKIGESMGVVEDVDITGDGSGWGRCLRIRVTVHLQEPLERGRALQLGGKSHWVNFKYEKLPRLCFNCGRIMHGTKGCPVKGAQRRAGDDSLKEWGVWLRADDPRRRASGERGGGFTKTAEKEHGGRYTNRGWDTYGTSYNSGAHSQKFREEDEVGSKCVETSHRGGARKEVSDADSTGNVGPSMAQKGSVAHVSVMATNVENKHVRSRPSTAGKGGDVGHNVGHQIIKEQMDVVGAASDVEGLKKGQPAVVEQLGEQLGVKGAPEEVGHDLHVPEEVGHVLLLPSLQGNVSADIFWSGSPTIHKGGVKGQVVEQREGMEGVQIGKPGNVHEVVTKKMEEVAQSLATVITVGRKWKKHARAGSGGSVGHTKTVPQATKRKAQFQEGRGKGLAKKQGCEQGDDKVPVVKIDLAGSASQPCQPK
jgi:hypothetical protein